MNKGQYEYKYQPISLQCNGKLSASYVEQKRKKEKRWHVLLPTPFESTSIKLI